VKTSRASADFPIKYTDRSSRVWSENLARQCGFSSLDYFTKAFRREVGMTPLAYRKMQRISRDVDDALK